MNEKKSFQEVKKIDSSLTITIFVLKNSVNTPTL